MITASVAAKYSPPLVAALALVDWRLAGGIAFGFAAGWAARAAVKVSARERSAAIWRDFLISVMISGGCLLLVLLAVDWFRLTELGAAVLSFILAMGGVKLLEVIHREAVEFLRRKLTDVDAVMGERRQDAQKHISAVKLAKKDEEQ